MTGYLPLPVLEPVTPGESLQGYGLRVLGFVVAYGCTATLSTDDLKLADHCYPIAVSRHDIDPRTVDTLSNSRRFILDTIKWREAEANAIPARDVTASRDAYDLDDVPPSQDDSRDRGTHDRLIPKPKPLAPAGAVQFAF